jgi:hypothetical protein
MRWRSGSPEAGELGESFIATEAARRLSCDAGVIEVIADEDGSFHHRYVHEYGYTIELGPDQRLCFRNPYGQLVPAVPAPPAMANLGWPRIRAMNEPLAIDADTIACEWDDNPVDYGAIVGHLVVAGGLG